MTIEEVSSSAYAQVIREPYHIFGSAAFNDLNAHKAENVFYLLYKDSRYRLGLVAAKNGSMLVSPFSAPFGGYSFISEDVRIKAIEEAVEVTEAWSKERGMDTIRYTLPPPVYEESFLAKVANVMYRAEYSIENMELNFHFDLSRFTPDYIQHIWHNARKNLNIALGSHLSFVKCDAIEEKQNAYAIIQRNRTVRGKPLRMTFEQIMATTAVIPADFFLVMNAQGEAIASAIVFTVASRLGQVVYWGDIPDHQPLKTMNYLSYKVFEYYKEQGYRALDIGYSTEDSMPNYGLCEFKESLGCGIQPKLTFSKTLASPSR